MDWSNATEVREHKRKWYLDHREREIERGKKWKLDHPERWEVIRRRWYDAHKKEAVARAIERNRTQGVLEYNQRKKIDVLTHYGNGSPECVLCGHDKLTSLSIDHINGNGNKHRREIKKCNTYRWLMKNNYPEGFRTLCMNCQLDERARLRQCKRQ